MNYRLTFGLLLALILVCALTIWVVRQPAAPEETTPALTNALLSPQPKAVTAISLARGGSTVLALEKAAAKPEDAGQDKWLLTAPVQAPTEPWTVSSIADSLRMLTYRDRFKPEASGNRSAEALGLKNPVATVKFTADGKEHTLLVGKWTPAKTVYVQLADDPKYIYEVSANWYQDLDKDPSDFRAKDLLSLDTAQVTGLTLSSPKQTVQLSKSAGKWVIDQPITSRASAAVLDQILSTLRTLRVESFTAITPDNPATGLGTPALTLTLYKAPPATSTAASQPATAPAQPMIVLTFGTPSDLTKKNIYAAVGGSKEAVLVSADAFGKLNKELKDLRDPAVTPAALADAVTVEIASAAAPDDKISLIRAGLWQMQFRGRQIPAEYAAVSEFLTNLQNLRAINYSAVGDLKSIGLDPPQQTITISVPGQAQRETILFGKPQPAAEGGNVTPVLRQGETSIYLVQSAEVAKLNTTPLALRAKMVDQIPVERIRSIEITGKSVAHPIHLSRPATTWMLSDGGKLEAADTGKVSALMGDLSMLMADKWISMNPERAQPPAAVAVITMDEAPASQPATTTTAPATGAAATTAPATAPAKAPAASRPATLPALTESTTPALPTKTIQKTLTLYQEKDGAYTAELTPPPVADGAITGWSFQPTPALVEHLTKTDYHPAPTTTSAPATLPAGN